MSETDKVPSAPSKKMGRKNKGNKETETRVAQPMQAKDSAQKQAIDLHASFQDQSRRVGELEAQLGEQEEQLKKAVARAKELEAKAARSAELEQELSTLRKQNDQVQSWSAELSSKSAALEKEIAGLRERAEASEKAAREELERAHERHVTVIRAKDEKVAALENRAKEGLKRLQHAHDSALREQAAKAAAGEKEAREELAKLQEEHEAAMRDIAPLRDKITELEAAKSAAAGQEGRIADLHRDVDALSQQVGQLVGARDKTRRELDEARGQLTHERDEAKKVQSQKEAAEQEAASLRAKVGDLELKAKEPPPADPRVAPLQKDLAAAKDEASKAKDTAAAKDREIAPLRAQVADLERKQRDSVAALQKDLEAAAKEAKDHKAKVAGLEREIMSLRDELSRAQAAVKDKSAVQSKETASLREELTRAQAVAKDAVAQRDRVAALQKDLASAQAAAKDAVAQKEKIAALQKDLASAQSGSREAAAQKEKVAALEKQLASLREELSKAKATGPQKDELAKALARADKAEAQSRESERFFTAIEGQLIEARAEADKAAELRAELDKMKEECQDHEEGLNQLAETVMELQAQIDAAEEAKAAAPPPPPPPPPPPAPVVVAPAPPPPPVPVYVDEDILAPKPRAPEPTPSMEFPKPEAIRIDPEFFAAPPAPKPAPAPVAVPPKVAAPTASSSSETTLRTNNTFGPDGPDGQPMYLLHELLGKDAMGVFYRATDRADGRSFMVRFLAGQAGEEQTRAFEKEVEKLVGLPHPNILHVQGSGRRKSRLYVMMDGVTAPTLAAAKIAEIPRIVAILRDAASAVHYAHEESVFHGDLTPEAILVGKEEGSDHAFVKDFGLAYLLETQTAALRNPAFLPPEQVRVLRTPLSASSDVYGLGATLFAALTGKPPFEGDPAKIVKRIMIEEPPPVEKIRADVPKAVGAVVRRAMAKERSVRYASAGDFADALTRIIDSGTK